MKKIITILLALTTILALVSCGKRNSYEIKVIIPAGSTEAYVYSDEEISPTKDTILISSGQKLSDTEVFLKPIEVKEENAYEPTYLTPGMPIKMDVEKGDWFKVGVAVQNPSNEDMVVTVNIENIEVRIE